MFKASLEYMRYCHTHVKRKRKEEGRREGGKEGRREGRKEGGKEVERRE